MAKTSSHRAKAVFIPLPPKPSSKKGPAKKQQNNNPPIIAVSVPDSAQKTVSALTPMHSHITRRNVSLVGESGFPLTASGAYTSRAWG